ncbi:unnamed protein product [Dibothriocephalus latus]|uniref:Uncharacterized protein n=1 Tax=Dibothriocephalus latus TaxID=60516 RepID=A0A3P6U4M0_DIBLA|nr:unnamed protein product [Dibothriocephalus latus]
MRAPDKLVIFTPHSLVQDKRLNGVRSDDRLKHFVDLLASRAQTDLHVPCTVIKATEEEERHKSFENLQKFLAGANAAILVLSGDQAHILDSLYPLMLVFLTVNPQWRKQMLIVFLGDPIRMEKFEPSILTTEPIIFQRISTNDWAEDKQKWTELMKNISGERLLCLFGLSAILL